MLLTEAFGDGDMLDDEDNNDDGALRENNANEIGLYIWKTGMDEACNGLAVNGSNVARLTYLG